MRAMRTRALLLCCACAAALAAATAGARDVHGVADAIALPGVALAWAVARGAGDASVVIRIAVDDGAATYADAAGIDPFTRDRKVVLAATRIDRSLDLRVPRAHFADFPRTELRFFDSEAAMRSNMPNLVVFYLGVPDTTPEFAGAAALDAYLADRIARLRRDAGSATP